MRSIKWVTAALAAGLVGAAHGATVLSEGFDDVAGLAGAGWVFSNASTSAGLPWFQGNSGIFAAQTGSGGSYAAVSFNSTTAVDGVVDNWLITPELALGAGATLAFSTRAADSGFFDRLEVRFSSGAASATASFSTVVGAVGSAASATYPVGSWVVRTFTLPTAATGRIGLRYTVASALDASYVGIDALTVTTVPEPATVALFGAGLAAVAAVRRRAAAPSHI